MLAWRIWKTKQKKIEIKHAYYIDMFINYLKIYLQWNDYYLLAKKWATLTLEPYENKVVIGLTWKHTYNVTHIISLSRSYSSASRVTSNHFISGFVCMMNLNPKSKRRRRWMTMEIKNQLRRNTQHEIGVFIRKFLRVLRLARDVIAASMVLHKIQLFAHARTNEQAACLRWACRARAPAINDS